MDLVNQNVERSYSWLSKSHTKKKEKYNCKQCKQLVFMVFKSYI